MVSSKKLWKEIRQLLNHLIWPKRQILRWKHFEKGFWVRVWVALVFRSYLFTFTKFWSLRQTRPSEVQHFLSFITLRLLILLPDTSIISSLILSLFLLKRHAIFFLLSYCHQLFSPTSIIIIVIKSLYRVFCAIINFTRNHINSHISLWK